MAENRLKKGFLFYFGLFLLIIVAAFLVIFVVMLFMPGTSILGLQYFSNDNVYLLKNTTDDKQTEINFENPNFSSVEINASYSEVIVQNNNDYEYNGVYIVNRSKGFVTSANARDFSFSATIDKGVLKIDVIEQPAFLYFSKQCQIVLHIANTTLNTFANKQISITTTDGDVNIGGIVNTGYSKDVAIGGVDVKTTGGNIYISSHAPSSYNRLILETASGQISSAKDTLSSSNFSLITDSGNITIGTVNSSGTLILNSKSGKIEINKISARVSSDFSNAYVSIKELDGNWDLSQSKNMESNIIKVEKITGSLTALEANNSKFEIGTILGSANIETSSGSVSIFTDKVSETSGKDFSKGLFKASTIKTNSGQINVVVAEGATGNIILDSQSGEINVWASNFNALTLNNKDGNTKVNMSINVNAKFNFGLYANTEGSFTFDKISFGRNDVDLINPVILGNGASSVAINSNANVSFKWF